MEAANGWLLTGTLAFGLVIVDLVRAAMKKHRGWRSLLFASLFCGMAAVLCALHMIYSWARTRAIDMLLDVVPTLAQVSFWALCVGVALNLLALWLHLRAEKNTKRDVNGWKR